MMTAAEYRAKAAAALAGADAATTPGVHMMYVNLAAKWAALSVTTAAEEQRARDLLGKD